MFICLWFRHHFEIFNVYPLYHPMITLDPTYYMLLVRGRCQNGGHGHGHGRHGGHGGHGGHGWSAVELHKARERRSETSKGLVSQSLSSGHAREREIGSQDCSKAKHFSQDVAQSSKLSI